MRAAGAVSSGKAGNLVLALNLEPEAKKKNRGWVRR